MQIARLKSLAVAAAVTSAAVFGIQTPARAVDAVPVLLCPFGCGPMAGDTILMNQMIQSQADVMLLPQETPGYMYNVREMGQNKNKWKTSIFATEDTLIQLAYAGGSKEMKEFLPEPVKVPWKLLYGEAWWGQGKFLATFDCSLKSMADLKGKRISLGLRGQSDWGVFSRLVLEHTFGVTPANSDIRHMTPGQLTQQLIDGATDAAVTPIGAEPMLKNFIIPGPVRQLEATGKKICYLGMTKAQIDALNKKFNTTFLHITPCGRSLQRNSRQCRHPRLYSLLLNQNPTAVRRWYRQNLRADCGFIWRNRQRDLRTSLSSNRQCGARNGGRDSSSRRDGRYE